MPPDRTADAPQRRLALAPALAAVGFFVGGVLLYVGFSSVVKHRMEPCFPPELPCAPDLRRLLFVGLALALASALTLVIYGLRRRGGRGRA